MGSNHSGPRRRSLLRRLKKFLLQRPWILSAAFWVLKFILERQK